MDAEDAFALLRIFQDPGTASLMQGIEQNYFIEESLFLATPPE